MSIYTVQDVNSKLVNGFSVEELVLTMEFSLRCRGEQGWA